MEGNYKALRRMHLLKRMMKDMGIEEKRFRLEWISASEGERVNIVINEMTDQVRALGPLGLPKKFAEWDKELELFEHEVNGKGDTVHA
jgi:F420-non-reducing hydrogenase iron-sulfur subunit